MFTFEDRGEAAVQHDIDGIFAVRARGQDFDAVDQGANLVDDSLIGGFRRICGFIQRPAPAVLSSKVVPAAGP